MTRHTQDMTTIKEYVTAGATDPAEKLEKKEKLMVRCVAWRGVDCLCNLLGAWGEMEERGDAHIDHRCTPPLALYFFSISRHTTPIQPTTTPRPPKTPFQASLPAYYEYAKFKFERGEYDDAYIFLNNYVTVCVRACAPCCACISLGLSRWN
jgi:hypothetical protein